MATVALSTSSVTLDPGTAYELTVLNSGTTYCRVQIGSGVQFDELLRPGQRTVVHPGGQAVTALVSAGTGEVQTTVSASLEHPEGSGTYLQVVNVLGHGVVGDGVTDDTAAMAALVASLPTALGQVQVIVPPEANVVVSTVALNSNVHYSGGGKFTHKPGSTQPILYWPEQSSPRVLIDNVLIENLDFYGEANDTIQELARSGVYIVGGKRVTLRNLRFYDFRSAGAHVQDCSDVTYDNLYAYRCSNNYQTETNSGGPGRNALEILGSTRSDTADLAHTWTVRNCKVDNAGASYGGASGISIVAQHATEVRATVVDNWAFNVVNGPGIFIEAGYLRSSSVTGNKTFGCQWGVVGVETDGVEASGVSAIDRVVCANNIVSPVNVTLNTGQISANGVLGATVAPAADHPTASGIDLMGSASTITGNTVRITNGSYGINLRGNTAGARVARVKNSAVTGNVVVVTGGAALPFGIACTYAQDVTFSNNRVDRVGSGGMRDAYYLSDINGLSFAGNSSRNAGRYAIQASTVINSSLLGGVHLDPATTGVLIGDALCTDLHIGGGMRVRDTLGTPTMTYGINANAAVIGNNITVGEVELTGWVNAPILGTANLNIDQRTVSCAITTPPTFGLPGFRMGYGTAAPTTGTWAVNDRIVNTAPTATGTREWLCTTAGTPGTWTAIGGTGVPAAFAAPPRPYYSGTLSTGTVSTVGGANQRRAIRMQGAATITKIGLYVGTSSGNIDVAVHRNINSGLTAAPGAPVAVSGSVACPAGSAYAEIALTGSIDVNDGDWLSVGSDNNTATFVSFSTGNVNFGRGLAGVAGTAFPAVVATLVGYAASSTGLYLVGIP